MLNRFSYLFHKNYAPRWLILQIDLFISLFSVFLAYVFRFNLDITATDFARLFYILPIYFVVRALSFRVFRTYAGIIRYTSLEDAKRIFVAITCGSLFFMVLNGVFELVTGTIFLPYSVVLFDYLVTLLFLTSFRVGVKIIYNDFLLKKNSRTGVVIYGAGKSGLITKRTLDQDGESSARVVAFIDDDPAKAGKMIEGVNIYKSSELDQVINRFNAKELIISIQKLDIHEKQQIVDRCLDLNVEVKAVPPAHQWLNGELSINQIRNVHIEDLLEREPIRLDSTPVARDVKGKVVMVTGASGSIGSELVRQLVSFQPEQVILIDQAETPLYELLNELSSKSQFASYTGIVGDVRNESKMRHLMCKFRPDLVYHVAAYKHVPLMEGFPSEAIQTNVRGTRIMADLAQEFGVEKFVFISTDKAVNPTNVMGASKRLAEMYVQSLDRWMHKRNGSNGQHGTRFITTRFGNVLGSNGSVIPLFRKQIAEGGPVTVTHEKISRYFMTIPEACQLILEAGAMGKGGEIFIFDMGEDVKIIDLAKKMIRLSGFTPGKDIPIVITGLRPGEKIREELLAQKENTLPTHHPKIMIASVREYDFQYVSQQVDELLELGQHHEDQEVVRKMKKIVPEFISNNSVFQVLDQMAS